MTDDSGDGCVRVWLAARSYTDRDLIVLEYATPDGERYLRRELAGRTTDAVPAALDADPERLAPVADEETRERYRTEVERVRDRNDPDDEL